MGLSIRLAQVYLANAQLGQTTIRTIADKLEIDRAEVNRALTRLERMGLTQRYITNPVTFKTTSIAEAISILLQQDVEKHNKIRDEAEEFIRKLGKQNNEKLARNDSRYQLTIGFKSERYKISKEVAELHTSMDCISNWEGLLFFFSDRIEGVQEALERGVKMRFITQLPEGDEIPQIIQTLTKKGSFEIKFASTFPKGGISILDGKRVHLISLPAEVGPNRLEILRLDNQDLVSLAQDYFDLKWQAATTPCWKKIKT
ncbi:MAG: hypothetical protein NWE95_07260 [Candidatus Bathyarchaeota archaeon]|nr:hypothetical protein [Candidatus Bathyarchaeota archaeon]